MSPACALVFRLKLACSVRPLPRDEPNAPGFPGPALCLRTEQRGLRGSERPGQMQASSTEGPWAGRCSGLCHPGYPRGRRQGAEEKPGREACWCDSDRGRRAGRTCRPRAEPTVRTICWHCPWPTRGRSRVGGGGERSRRNREDKRQLSKHHAPTTEASTRRSPCHPGPRPHPHTGRPSSLPGSGQNVP